MRIKIPCPRLVGRKSRVDVCERQCNVHRYFARDTVIHIFGMIMFTGALVVEEETSKYEKKRKGREERMEKRQGLEKGGYYPSPPPSLCSTASIQ